MSRNQPFDFTDDDDISLASGSANTTDAEYTEFGWADSPEMGSAMEDTGRQGQKTRKSQTATHMRRSAEQPDSPTSMSHKRGNQPR
jgi:hypothetical protein